MLAFKYVLPWFERANLLAQLETYFVWYHWQAIRSVLVDNWSWLKWHRDNTMCTWIIKIVRDEFNGIVNDSIVISRSYRQSCPRVKNTPSVNDAVVIRILFPRNIHHCRRRQVGSPQVSPSSPVSVVEMVATKDHFTVEGMDAPCAIMFDMSHSVCSVHLHKRDVNWRRHKGKATSLVTKIQSLLTVLINILRTFLDTHFSYSLVLKYAFKGGDHQQLNYTQARQSCMTFSSRLISTRHYICQTSSIDRCTNGSLVILISGE